MNYKQQIAKAVSNALNNKVSAKDILSKIEYPKTDKNGDLSFPCFVLAKVFHKNPKEIADNLVKKIDHTGFDKIEAVGPYLNFFFDRKQFSEDVLNNILKDGSHYGDNNIGKGRNVVIDMSSPNIAKPISMGHLRSTVIGNSIAQIMMKSGFKTIKDNHLGDWGTQFGKLITAYLKWGNKEAVEKDPINKLVKYYVHFHRVDKQHPELDDEARAWFKKLESGNKEAMDLWKWFRHVSLISFHKTYEKLGVKFDTHHGESFYRNMLPGVVKFLKQKGLLHKSQGAQVVDLSKYHLNPALILKSDGATLYITRDIACAIWRDRNYHPAMNIYVTGGEQIYYFKQLKAVLNEMGLPKNVHHVPFGLITENGKKLSTRSGRIILLNKVLDDAVRLAKKQIQEKNPTLPNKDEVAREVGVGAIIFGDLKNNRMDSINFNLKQQLQFEGETGPYVMYCRVRAESILRKAGKIDLKNADKDVKDPEAWNIIKSLNAFPKIVREAGKEFEPSDVAKYALHLSKDFNQYYAHSRILKKDPQLGARLSLVKSVSIVLKESMRLLGVKAPNRM
ncbi:arginine--tRNA ligase [Acetilactobacillus jinshanensis]|uniref:Arginine--tRNA ligase n=1 Tax=Acetilactobacillus jinshanensis TaxID=1720083 RepID=A0A4P6ZLQ0_9LACO|nr:arginine--tRNA ligase [Acetilactobacillus jinshanensis]QBP18694.1 arginine--tRNA ligase [Acetilactobacillus jinshanensis]URL61569.1 arginine--tRNA ligase [uncultured bacterium]